MPKRSAGILAYRRHQQQIEVLLVHPGGPFFRNKDEGVWSIPKGEYDECEEPLSVAIREFEEETGNKVDGKFIPLDHVKIKSGKVISAWAVEADFQQCYIRSNTFDLEWPPKSGKMQSFPEADKAEWFSIAEAKKKIHPGQLPLLDQLASLHLTR